MADSKDTVAASVSTRDDGVLLVDGDMVFDTVVDLRLQLLDVLPKGVQSVDVDLAGVHRADSSGLSLLLEWQRLASARGVRLSYSNLPDQLGAIADLSELRPVLALKG